VTRVHGYDLYEERFAPPFQPWVSMYAELDRIFAISRHGVQALRRYGVPASRIRLARLGTAPARSLGGPSTDGIHRVLSCSSVIPLKRVPLIARSVVAFARRHPDRRIQWTHIGDGPDLEAVREALEDAPPNFEAVLRGALPHEAVLSFLAERPVDVFLLLSETEGLPVSLQEALAHGVPVVATDVGGVAEAVDGEVGFLLPPDPDPSLVADALGRLLAMSPAERAACRQRALACWARDFDARANRRAFVDELHAAVEASFQLTSIHR
jgi:colanic acid/amylovoran biosynthesis glycosyltransferase